MPKMSKATAPSHLMVPDFVEEYEQEMGGWTVTWEHNYTDMDEAPFFKGAPGDQCPASHVGFVIKGRFGARKADGTEEVFEAGDAFVLEPGHTPIVYAGSEFVAFTPTAEARQQTALMMPNIVKFAEEHGIELPKTLTAS
ncbi:MAG TPA: hypothetical protein VFL69_12895 [Marmoricola sp.]|nr:hypothetical protein [Marmoricola sp.]